MLFLKKSTFQKYCFFCSRFTTFTTPFTFDLWAFFLLSVICKQQVKQYNYYVNQSERLTRFWTGFTSSVLNFCRRVADVPPGETSPVARSKEKRLYSQVPGTVTAAKMSLKEWIHILSIFTAIIPTHLLCEMQENSPGVEFLRTISKFRKR